MHELKYGIGVHGILKGLIQGRTVYDIIINDNKSIVATRAFPIGKGKNLA